MKKLNGTYQSLGGIKGFITNGKKSSTKTSKDGKYQTYYSLGGTKGYIVNGKKTSQKPKSFKTGGKVKKTGIYKLHKGELVLSKKQKNAVASALKNIHD